jgi:hypothetical protein
MTKAQTFDAVVKTFTRDQEFCEELATRFPRDAGRLLICAHWVHQYLNPIQDDLSALCRDHFPEPARQTAAYWTLTLTGGIGRDVLLIPYLVVRGAVSEAGFALRRSIENVGVLTHLWNEPANSAFLGSPDDQLFRKAFVWEADNKRRDDLRSRRIQKRFERSAMPEALSNLYALLSAFTVHGGSPAQLAAAQLEATPLSCALLNRPDPRSKDLLSELNLLGNGCEMLCIEVVSVHGTYSKKYRRPPSKGGEGGFYLTKLLNPSSDAGMAQAVEAMLQQIGWTEGVASGH